MTLRDFRQEGKWETRGLFIVRQPSLALPIIGQPAITITYSELALALKG